MPRVKVTGYIELEDDEFDPGPRGPLTEETDMRFRTEVFSELDDLTFELAD